MAWSERIRRVFAAVIGNVQSAQPGTYRALDEVSAAVVELANAHIGAIIVIERETGLEDFVDTGVRLDAEVSTVLIEDIFVPNAPLHDKAVIVRGDRLIAASCPLPVAEGVRVGHLGMRHKAGLGISEQTDAVAVVVSEERGTVSIGFDGHLLQLEEPSEVRFALHQLVERKADVSLIPGLQVA